jgi:hypothetical protein
MAFWVPMALREPKGVSLAVEEMALDNNPLRLFLRKRG